MPRTPWPAFGAAGIPDDRINLLAPGAERELRRVPTTDTEQPGVGPALGGVVGAPAARPAGCRRPWPQRPHARYRAGGRARAAGRRADRSRRGSRRRRRGRGLAGRRGPEGRAVPLPGRAPAGPDRAVRRRLRRRPGRAGLPDPLRGRGREPGHRARALVARAPDRRGRALRGRRRGLQPRRDGIPPRVRGGAAGSGPATRPTTTS